MSEAGVLQDDLRELLALLGMDDGARPQSPHEVFQECLAALRRRLAGGAPEGWLVIGVEARRAFVEEADAHEFAGKWGKVLPLYQAPAPAEKPKSTGGAG